VWICVNFMAFGSGFVVQMRIRIQDSRFSAISMRILIQNTVSNICFLDTGLSAMSLGDAAVSSVGRNGVEPPDIVKSTLEKVCGTLCCRMRSRQIRNLQLGGSGTEKILSGPGPTFFLKNYLVPNSGTCLRHL
jgi:hypothetical protein